MSFPDPALRAQHMHRGAAQAREMARARAGCRPAIRAAIHGISVKIAG
jgi:hypothetical protein